MQEKHESSQRENGSGDLERKYSKEQIDEQKQKYRPWGERAWKESSPSIESCATFKAQIKMSLNNR